MKADEDLERGLLPVLWELREHLPQLVLIGGWVPQLHRWFSGERGWSMLPVATVELDILLPEVWPGDTRRSLVETLLEAGFRPVGESRPPAVWERDEARGERIEFFLDHRGPGTEAGKVRVSRGDDGSAGLSLEGLGFLREESVVLQVPSPASIHPAEPLGVRVPTLPAFLVHKGAIFFRRRERDRKAKDLLYIVEIMAQGDSLVERMESGIQRLCRASSSGSSVARTARNNLFVLLSQPDPELLSLVAEALQVRRGWSPGLALARAGGFLSDFAHLIPEDSGS